MWLFFFFFFIANCVGLLVIYDCWLQQLSCIQNIGIYLSKTNCVRKSKSIVKMENYLFLQLKNCYIFSLIERDKRFDQTIYYCKWIACVKYCQIYCCFLNYVINDWQSNDVTHEKYDNRKAETMKII